MSRGIIVWTTGRSGSSMLGAILNELGVRMGGEFVDVKPYTSPSGSWEDLELYELFESATDHPLDLSELIRILDNRSKHHNLWGVKVPRMCEHYGQVISALNFTDVNTEYRAIAITRKTEDTVASLVTAAGSNEDWARKFIRYRTRLVDNALALFPGRTMRVRYEDLLDPDVSPQEIARLSVFCTGDWQSDRLARAFAIVDPELARHTTAT